MYEYNPWKEEDLRERLRYLDGERMGAGREELVRVLRKYHAPELLSPAIERELDRLLDPRSVVVIGGQQAGLLTGPLYTIYKAVTLIQVAKREERRWKRPVIPVFWIAGEDHDREEVDHVYVQGEAPEPIKHQWPEPAAGKTSVSQLVLAPKALHTWLEELARLLPDSEYKQEWLDGLKALAPETVGWSRYFARLLHKLFGEAGLVLIDSADPGVRRLEAAFFAALVEKSRLLQAHVQKASAMLFEQGFATPVHLQENQANLFLQVDGERQALFVFGEQWMTKNGEVRLTEGELLRIAADTPDRLSNNVITRPLMQEYLFPTLMFVGGAGEIAYWGLLKEAFHELGLKMPPILPRWQFTVLDRRAQKRMEEFRLTCEESLWSLPEKKAAWLASQAPPDLDAKFAALKQTITAEYGRLVASLERDIGRNMREMGRKNQDKVLGQVDYYYHYTKRMIEEKHQVELRHWDELIHSITPEGKPQERVLNLVSVWNRLGLDWLGDLLASDLARDERRLKHYCLIV